MTTDSANPVRHFEGKLPQLGERVYVDPSAVVLGAVTLGDDVSVWPQATIRGDMHSISVGNRTSIQDGCVLHITHAGPYNPDGWPLVIGDEVTVGHNATLHGCTVGNRVLVGMGAIVMDGAVVEDEVVIAAGALVTPGKRLASMVFPVPGGPIKSRLWRPLAAISNALFARGWPITSLISRLLLLAFCSADFLSTRGKRDCLAKCGKS